MVKRYFKLGSILTLTAVMTLLASGCAQKTAKVDEIDSSAPTETVATQDKTETMETEITTPSQPVPGTEESLDTPASDNSLRFTILEGRTTGPMLPVYFDFDKSNIRNDQKSRIERNAKYIKENRGAKIVIEGNCDEMGTNEYNMALGERRAISAKKYLVNLGVDSNIINTISFGEEKPLNHGHDELAWSQNRRSDFVRVQ